MSQQVTNESRFINYCTICGVLKDNFQYSHTAFGIRFYKNSVEVVRDSGVSDYVPILVPKKSIHNISSKGKYVELRGKIHSILVKDEEGHNHLKVDIYPFFINICDTIEELQEELNSNHIYLKGVVHNPKIRRTPFGKTITDFMITINRPTDKKIRIDHIPCIAWYREAEYISKLEKRGIISIEGRFQSRVYYKEEKGEYQTTYEVSVMAILN